MVASNSETKPTISDIIALELITLAKISPVGDKVAFCVRSTNWKSNRYESNCFIYDNNKGKTFQLTRYGKINQIVWINNDSIAVLKEDPEMKDSSNQIFVFAA